MKVGQGDLLFVCDQGSLVGHRMQDYKCLYTLGVVGVEGGVTPAFSVLGNGIYEIARRTSRAIRLRNVKNGEKSHNKGDPAKTGSGNMAENTSISSQTPTSYSTVNTLGVYLDSFWSFVGNGLALRPL